MITCPCQLNGNKDPHCPNPVTLSSGAMWHVANDFTLPGRTPSTALSLTRTYTANASTIAGDFGPNWRHSYETKLETPGQSLAYRRSKRQMQVRATSTSLIWIDENGGPWLFDKNSDTTYAGPPGLDAVLTEFSDHFELLKKNRQKLTFGFDTLSINLESLSIQIGASDDGKPWHNKTWFINVGGGSGASVRRYPVNTDTDIGYRGDDDFSFYDSL